MIDVTVVGSHDFGAVSGRRIYIVPKDGMNLHDCREVGAKDALIEFVLQNFASIC